MRRERAVDILKVASFIEKNPNTYLKEISRSLSMNPAIVHRTLKDIQDFIITRPVNQDLGLKLPNLPVLIRLKEGVTTEGIAKFIKIKKKLDQIVEEK